MPKSNQNPFSLAPLFSCSWVNNKPSSSSSLSTSLSINMAPHQKTTTQHKKPKSNLFLTCFGFSSKNNNIKKPKTKKSGSGRKKSFKFCWPKLKVIVIKKKDIILDPKTAALKASHDIVLQATKIHQLKLIDHHHQFKNPHEQNVTSKGSKHAQDNKSQSHCATCHDNINPSTPKIINSSILTDKVSKDSLIGVSLMVMMLIIMSIWGRLCAILCFSALLYCIPFIRPPNRVVRPNHTENKLGSIHNMKLQLDKTKVVLQGLLQRDHKNNAIGIS